MNTSRRSVLSGVGSILLVGGGTTTATASDKGSLPNVEELISGVGYQIHDIKEEDPESVETFASQLDAEGAFDLEQLKAEASNSNRQTYRLRHLAELLNTEFGVGIPASYIDDINVLTRNLDSYLPVISAGQNLIAAGERYQIAREKDKKIQETEEELMISIFLFVCELCFLQSSATYRLSFSGTRYVANMGLVRVRRVLGMRGYALILSEVHWAIRGTLTGIKTTILERSGSIAVNHYDELKIGELSEFKELSESDLDYDFLENSPVNKTDAF